MLMWEMAVYKVKCKTNTLRCNVPLHVAVESHGTGVAMLLRVFSRLPGLGSFP